MTEGEIDEFIRYLDGAWQPGLTDVQATSWRALVWPLDTKTAFTVLAKLFKTAARRPAPPEFREVYRAELRNTTAVQPHQETARDEVPEWVRGWKLSRAEGDFRLWPEEKEGMRACHEAWQDDIGKSLIRTYHLKSGYEWSSNVAEFGTMPAKDRAEYMRRALAGEKPLPPEEKAEALAKTKLDAEGLPVDL